MVQVFNPETGLMEEQDPFAAIQTPVATGNTDQLEAVVPPAVSMPAQVPPVAQPNVGIEPTLPKPKTLDITQEQKTTQQKFQTPEEKKIQKEQEGLTASQIALQNQKNVLEVNKNQIAADEAFENSQRLMMKQADVENTISEGQVALAARQKEYDDRYNDYKNMSYKDFWSDKSAGTQITAALAMAMGAFGQAMTKGSSNSAMEMISKAIDRDFDKQRAQMAKGKETVTLAKEGIDVGRQDLNDKLKLLDVKEAAAKEAVAAHYASELRQLGVPEAQIAGNAAILKLQQDANEKKQKVQEDLRQQVTTQTDKKLGALNAGNIKAETDLRQEFNKLPEVEDWKTTKYNYDKIKTAPNNGAGDLVRIISLMKIQDPPSIVSGREGDTVVASTDNWPPWVRQQYNMLTGGEIRELSPAARAKIQVAARASSLQKEKQFNQAANNYRRLAVQQGLAPANIVLVTPLDGDDSPPEQKQKAQKNKVYSVDELEDLNQ